ncbi:hypothetical protein pEaSNUABM37_00158 [Erwinia phage pEa_SNUABM_37]|nr:hypothetical protein pEaSNUABM37_00158 [Erwinia phage pEa_SNUABM_37]QXO10628.1 hypothetical protein pEaSNUABM48_00158 [Erwinia phage pEa_SNUABM_48]
MSSNKLTAFVDSIAKIAKAGEIPVLEMDAAAQEVTEEFFRIWLVSRIRHNKALARDIKEDKVYTVVAGYAVRLNSEFFYPRMWSEAGIKDIITQPIESDQDLLEFVYRGGATLYARIFGKSNDNNNPSFDMMTKHICDSLCIMSNNSDKNLVSETHRSVFPVYQTTLQLFTANPWLVFIYYLCRIDIYEMITATKGSSK